MCGRAVTPTALQWMSLVAVIWLQAINGTNSDFPAYSSQLKNLLSMSQVQLNNLAFASDAGKLFGWISGYAADYLPLWVVLLIGSFLGLLGYGVQYIFVADNASSLTYGHMFLLTVLAGNSICWINTVCNIVAIQNFSVDRQLAVGLATSYLGLSAKIYTDIVQALYSPESTKTAQGYLLLNAVVPLMVSLAASPLVRIIKAEKAKGRDRDRDGFIVLFVITVATGAFAVISSSWSSSIGLSPLATAVSLGALLLSPAVVPLAEKIKERFVGRWLTKRETKVHDCTLEENMGANKAERGENERDKEKEQEVEVEVEPELEQEEEEEQVRAMEEVGVKVMLTRVDFWLYFLVYLSGATLGLVYLNNLGQISESRGCSKTASLVSLSSSFTFFGRLLPSLLDYFFSRSRYLISRPGFIVALMAPMVAAFALLLDDTDVALYTSTAIIGVCSGAITSISVSLTSELFGSKNFGVNHNVVVANIPIGSFLFGYTAAIIYHAQADGHGKCMGIQCYRTTFIIWASTCFVGTCSAFLLYARTRKFYSGT